MSTVDYCTIPAAPPPKGQNSNLSDPEDLSIETLAVGSVLTALSMLFLIGRILVNRKRLAMADYLAVVGFIFSTGYSGVIMDMHSYSRHIWDVPACWYMEERLWKLLFASNFMLRITQLTTKLPIMVLYLQIFSVERRMKLFIKSAITFSGVVYIPHPILVIIFQTPHAGETWTDLATNGRPQKMTYYAPIHGVCEVLLNIWMLVIPLLVIRNLQITRRKKIQLGAVFLTGIMGIVASLLSAYWRFKLLLDYAGDQLWQEAQLFIWIMLENNVALIVGCMPALAAFIRMQSSGSNFFKSLRSKVFVAWSGGKNRYPKVIDRIAELPSSHGFKSNDQIDRQARSYYYAVNGNASATQVDFIVPQAHNKSQFGENQQAIFKFTAVSQENHNHSSV